MARVLLCCLLLSLACAVSVAQPEAVINDIRVVDDLATKVAEQREREAAMRRLGESNDPAAYAKLISLLNDDFLQIRTTAERILAASGAVHAVR